MRKTHRYISAFVLCVLYTLIVLSPLAPLALRSVATAHALTGECAGECGLCGCSPERSASQTCCCWRKKMQQARVDDDHDEPECCRQNNSATKTSTVINGTPPCNGMKTMALVSAGPGDVLPFLYDNGMPVVVESSLVESIPLCPTDWPGEPPDPPPRLSNLS